MALSPSDVEEVLADAEVVPCLQAAVTDAKELLSACLEAEIPAVLDRPECCETGGCGTKLELLVRPEDLPRVQALLHGRWQAMLDREGTLEQAAGDEPEGDPPCPACNHQGALVEGACAGCQLQLA